MKTREEVEALKKIWQNDPIWDIEHTEGFEEYAPELLAFSNDMHSKWRKESARRLAKSFNGQVGKIKKELFQLDNEVGYAHSELELASLEIARLNVRALLLVAEQLADIQDAIEDHTAYIKCLGGE